MNKITANFVNKKKNLTSFRKPGAPQVKAMRMSGSLKAQPKKETQEQYLILLLTIMPFLIRKFTHYK